MDIIKAIKQALYKIRHKPKCIVEKKIAKKTKPTVKKAKPAKPKRKYFYDNIVRIDSTNFTLKELSKYYCLNLKTIEARYRVGNRGKLLIRPSQKQQG